MTNRKLHLVDGERRKHLQASATIGHVERRSIDVFTTYAASIMFMVVVLRGAPVRTRMRCVYHTTPACARARAPCTTSALPADLLSILTVTLPRKTCRSARAPSREVDRDVAPRSEKDVLCACG